MDEQAFDELEESVREGGAILRGVQEPSRRAVMLRDAKGHFLPGQQPPGIIRSSEQARSMALRKRELGAIAARKALAEKAAENGLQRSPAAAVGLAAGTLYDAALTVAPEGKLREAVEGFRMSFRLADMLPADERAQVPTVAIQVNIAPELAREWE